MSTNLHNLQNLLNKPGTTTSSNATTGTSGTTLSDLMGKGAGNDSQTFAKLMAQYQSPQQAIRNSVPSAATAQPRAAAEALRAKTASQAMAQRPPQQVPKAPEQAKSSAEAQQSQQSQQAKSAQKSSSQQAAKSGNDARAKARQAEGDKHAARADKMDKPDADGADAASDEVKFATHQGEGAAQVRELQPPPDVPTSDPAAMMAWLATLSQGGEAAAAAGGDGALTEGGTGTGSATPDPMGSHAGKGGPGGPGALPTGTAALTTQLRDQQAFKGDAKTLAAEGLGAGATAAIATQDAGSPLEFNALMARELSRPVGGAGPGVETSTHATATLPTPVDSADFKQALVERVGMWVSGTPANGQMTAELRLNPEDMGPVHIRIVMDGQNAQVDFAAAHAETRQALEASLPALSSALQDAGLSLAGGGVSDQSASQAWAQQQQGQGQGQGDGHARSMAWSGRGLGTEQPDTDNLAGLPPVARPAARPGGLDLYA